MDLNEAIIELNKNNIQVIKRKSIMERFYNILSNEHELQLMEKINTGAIYKRHGKYGFIIISANRSDEPKEKNEQNTKNLISDIQKNHFRYLPVYGGYRGSDGVEDDYEPSFIVFPYQTDTKENNPELLYNFAIEMCGKYNQDSVYIMKPGGNPNYYDREGNIVNSSSSKDLKINDLTQPFFTSFKDKAGVEKEQDDQIRGLYKRSDKSKSYEEFKKDHLNDVKVGRRFTSDIQFEHYANPKPVTLNERMRRELKGEIIY